MRFIKSFFLLISISISAQTSNKYSTFFEKGNGNQSATYNETISFYKTLDQDFQSIKIEKIGLTDCGEPLQLVIFNPEKQFDFKILSKKKSIILINNAIHAGEPDGIDATMMLFRDLALSKIKIPKNTIIVAIPIYNIEGALNRNSTSRTNQNGPEEYGFRGNGRNYDLNRDMIKSDTRNTKSLVEIFHKINPDVFIDNHVSNGADYQYTLTYIQTEPTKLGKELGGFMKDKMTPSIVENLKLNSIESTPYVNVWDGTPEKGFAQFNDTPRYTTGYTSLFNTIGYVVETHMWKEYKKRVNAMYQFMQSTINYVDANSAEIKNIRKKNVTQFKPKDNYPIQWVLDSSKLKKIPFLGYEGSIIKSKVTTGNRLFYDRTKPFTKEIDFYPAYKPSLDIVIPKAYIIPKSWWTIIDLLKSNKCNYSILKNDTIIDVESYKIANYKTTTSAYEGHYNHRNTLITKSTEKKTFAIGDYVFSTSQPSIKYILETLEPQGVDSFFNWNFFDTILQQKEGYSSYIFEDLAAKILIENSNLKMQFEEKLASDEAFAKDTEEQLDWVHKHSIYYEKEHLQYPVYRITK